MSKIINAIIIGLLGGGSFIGGIYYGLEYTFHKSGGKITEFHLSSFKGEIFSVHTEEEPDAPPPPKPRYSMYGEEVDEQPSMWKEK